MTNDTQARSFRSTRQTRRTCAAPLGQALGLVVGVLFLCWSSSAFAQANYESVQVGGRTAMMGGSAVANGTDQAAVFVNPATITRIPERSFAFSTFAAQFRGRTIGKAVDPSGRLKLASSDVNQIRLRIQPNTFCLFLDGPPKDEYSGRSRHKYALCAVGTEREELEFTKNRNGFGRGNDVRGTSHSTTLKFLRSSLAYSWGYQLNRDISIGVTSRIDNARLNDQTTATSFAISGSTGSMQTLDHSIEAFSWDTSLVVGLMYNVSRVVTLGASLATPSQHLFGRYASLSMISATDGLPTRLTQDDGDFRYNHPGSLRMGFAFTWPRLILGVDASFYGPQRQIARANFDRRVITVDAETNEANSTGVDDEIIRASVSDRGKPVTNLSLGAEYFVRRDFSLVAGVQTDFSGIHPRQDALASEVLFRQQKDAIHGALGFTTYGESGRLLLGIRGHFARGNLLIADAALYEPSFVAVPQAEWGLNLVVSGSLTFGAVKAVAVRAIPVNQKMRSAREKKSETEEGSDP